MRAIPSRGRSARVRRRQLAGPQRSGVKCAYTAPLLEYALGFELGILGLAKAEQIPENASIVLPQKRRRSRRHGLNAVHTVRQRVEWEFAHLGMVEVEEVVAERKLWI